MGVVIEGRRRRARGILAAIVVIAALGALPEAAHADQVSDKQAQADAIAAKVDELNHTIEQYAEAANGAQIELDTLNQQVADAQAKVEAAKVEQASHQAELRTYAIDAYVHGSDDVNAAMASTDDFTVQGQREGYLSAASGNRQQLIDELRATQEDVKIQIGQLNQAQSAAEAKSRDLNDKKAQASSAATEQQQLLDQAKGELADLVAQAQAKKAAEEEAAAQARARAAAASASVPASGGGGSSSSGGGGGGGGGGSKPVGPAPSVRGGAGAAIAAAQSQLGKPYVWGAAGPSSYDCSGLTMYAWRAGGVSLSHYTGSQYAETTHISLSSIQPGDLIFYDGMEHVALYVGNGQIIHAPHAGSVVKYDSLYYWNTSMVASRP